MVADILLSSYFNDLFLVDRSMPKFRVPVGRLVVFGFNSLTSSPLAT